MKVGLYFNKKYSTENRCNLDKTKREFDRRNVFWKVVNVMSDLDGLDVLMVFGGDGTILTVATECAIRGVKIIGINYGHMGFLAEFEPERIDSAISLVCSGSYVIDQRSMLKVDLEKNTYYALNDVVIQRSTSGNSFSNTINLSADIDGTTVDNFSADGLIVSTPTGSTAYSLSAGGSILTPDINAFIMTPICAHSLHSRPIVFNDRSLLTVRQTGSRGQLNMIIDGIAVEILKDGCEIKVTKADYFVEFITAKGNDFYRKLLIKLNKWSK